LACYLGSIIVTGFVPLSPALDVPLGVTGWLLFAAPMLWGLIRRRKYRTEDLIADLLRPAPLTAVFAVLVLISSYFALAWQMPPACHGISLSCYKGYEWSTQDGQYYHVTVEGLRAQNQSRELRLRGGRASSLRRGFRCLFALLRVGRSHDLEARKVGELRKLIADEFKVDRFGSREHHGNIAAGRAGEI
jgi:hypothetical protein